MGKKKKKREDDSDSQPGGDMIEECNHRLLFPGFLVVSRGLAACGVG